MVAGLGGAIAGLLPAFSLFPASFLRLKQTVQNRPTFILSHRVLCARDGVGFAAEL